MPKQNRKPGIHLHKTKKTIRKARYTKSGIPATAPIVAEEYYWILIAKNGKTIAKSSEAYKRKRDAVRGIKIAKECFYFSGHYYDHTAKEVEQVVY